MSSDKIGDRMKSNYENRSKSYLTRRTPVIIRIDGKAFHTFTRGMVRPFDEILMASMVETAKYLVKNIQGCKIAYKQSDEISLLLTDYDTLTTDAWFDYSIQKLVSISASMATLSFNNSFSKHEVYKDKFGKAMFDSRAFNIPKEEVCNYFIWRQQDATRNSIQSVGQYYFSHKELHNKSTSDVQNMLLEKHNVNWDKLDANKKRGVCIIKDEVDYNIPIFSQEREYIERFI